MPMLSLALLLLATPPQDMLAQAVVPPRTVVRTSADPRDARIASLEAEVARLKRELAQTPGEWRVSTKNPAYEVYGRQIGGEFCFIASRKRK